VADGCSFCEGDADGDHRITLSSAGTAAYTIRFGSMIRPGEIAQLPIDMDPRQVSGGRRKAFESSISNESHVWIGSGPLRIENSGPDGLVVQLAGHREDGFTVPADGSVSTSCPTAQKRTVALGAAAGGVLGAVRSVVLDR